MRMRVMSRRSCAVYRSVLQCVAVCCSVLQCVAVCCSTAAPHCTTLHHTAPHCTTLHHSATKIHQYRNRPHHHDRVTSCVLTQSRKCDMTHLFPSYLVFFFGKFRWKLTRAPPSIRQRKLKVKFRKSRSWIFE